MVKILPDCGVLEKHLLSCIPIKLVLENIYKAIIIKSRSAIRVLNYCRPRVNAKRLNDVANTLLWLATMYSSCCCVNCRCQCWLCEYH